MQECIHQFNQLWILLNLTDPIDKLVLKFKSKLREHLYQELKYMDITTFDVVYNQAQLAKDKLLDQHRIQQHSSSTDVFKSTTSKPTPHATTRIIFFTIFFFSS